MSRARPSGPRVRPGDVLVCNGWTAGIKVWATRDAALDDNLAIRLGINAKNLADGNPIMVLEVYPLMVSGGRRLLAIMVGRTVGWVALTDQTLAGLPVVART